MIPYQEMPQPENILELQQWGAGNYFIEDKITGQVVRISPELFWKILDYAEILMKTIKENEAPNAE